MIDLKNVDPELARARVSTYDDQIKQLRAQIKTLEAKRRAYTPASKKD